MDGFPSGGCLKPQDPHDSRAQEPWDSWIPLWRATEWLERAESKRKWQVNFLEHEVEHLKNKLAESQEQCANAYAAAEAGGNVGEQVRRTNGARVVIATEERPESPQSIDTTDVDERSDRDVESVKEDSNMDTHSGASETEATDSSRFLQLIRLQDGSAENGSEFLPTELLPLLLDFLPVDEVLMSDVRAVSRFFASPKAWVFHLFKLIDIDSLPTWSSEKQMHPVVECFHKCLQAEDENPEIQERRDLLAREYLLGTSERCRGFVLWVWNLPRWQLYQPDLVHHFIDVCLEDLDYQLVEPFWWMASLLHNVYPWPDLRLRIARRMMDIGGVAKEQEIVRMALNVVEPVYQCIDKHLLAEFVRIITSDEALFSSCFYKAIDMADIVLTNDLARLVAFRKHLSRALLKPELLSKVRHELLELLAG